MTRVRLSTTTDADLLAEARRTCGGTDASLLEAALRAYLREHRRSAIDDAYRAYDDLPIATLDEWGDLESFRAAAGVS